MAPVRLAVSKGPVGIEFPVGGVTSFVMRRVLSPDGAVDLRILGAAGEPAILSLIGPDGNKYADYTYNGFDADLDVSYGGLNLRPLDGSGAVNVWSMAGNTPLRVGSRNFEQAVSLWHSGSDGNIESTKGNIIIRSPLETTSSNILGGSTFIKGKLRVLPTTPASSAATCDPGEAAWDEQYMYVCTARSGWKRARLSTY